MRQIGTIPKNLDAKILADHLLSLGIKTRIDDRPEGELFWVYNEDHLDRARAELLGFLEQPNDPRFRISQQAAEERRREERELERRYRKNYREVSDQWAYPGFRRRPLTMLMMAASIIVYLLLQSPRYAGPVLDKLGFYSWMADEPENRPQQGLTDIAHGEVWRLVTPIFLHFSLGGLPLLHLLFNMTWLSMLGTMIEIRRGTFRFFLLVLTSALLSNLAEYLYMSHYLARYALFGGMSGVNYALFGFAWVKGHNEPEQRIDVHPNNVALLLIWLVVCMTGALGPVANAAHFGGLVVGMILAMLRL